MPDRYPYVGKGVDGCLRSAAIDRSEADGYNLDDPNVQRCLESALAWEAQATRLANNTEAPTQT
jgi:hypothetical protein